MLGGTEAHGVRSGDAGRCPAGDIRWGTRGGGMSLEALEAQRVEGCDCLPKTQVYAKPRGIVCELMPAQYLLLDRWCVRTREKTKPMAAVTLTVLR